VRRRVDGTVRSLVRSHGPIVYPQKEVMAIEREPGRRMGAERNVSG